MELIDRYLHAVRIWLRKAHNQFAAAINLWAGRSLPVVIVLGLVVVGFDAYRITLLKRADGEGDKVDLCSTPALAREALPVIRIGYRGSCRRDRRG
jgi:hypothetical protein